MEDDEPRMALADLPDGSVEAVVVPDVEDTHDGTVDLRPWHFLQSIRAHRGILFHRRIPRLLICPDDDLCGCCQCGEQLLGVVGDSRFHWWDRGEPIQSHEMSLSTTVV